MPSKIAYIVSRFPHLPETFILREMIHLEKLGWQVELYPLILQHQELNNLVEFDQRKYGSTLLIFYERA